MQTPCRLGPPPQGPAGAACTPGRAATSGSPGRHTPGPGNRKRQKVPPFQAPACSGENVRPGKDECEEGSREERGRARFGSPGRPGCGAGFSRAGTSRPPRGSFWLTPRGWGRSRSGPRPPCEKQGRVKCHPPTPSTPTALHGEGCLPGAEPLHLACAPQPHRREASLKPRCLLRAGLFGEERNRSRGRVRRKPQRGCQPGLRWGAIREGGPRPRTRRSTRKDMGSSFCWDREAGPTAEQTHSV